RKSAETHSASATARRHGPPGRQREGIVLWRKIASTTGIRNSSSAFVTSSKDASASSPLFRRNARHCVCFAGLAENSGVKAKGRGAGKTVFRLAKVAESASANTEPANSNLPAITQRS